MFMCVFNGITSVLAMSSAIGQEAAFGVYQISDRFKVKFSSLGDWYIALTVNIATLWPECYALTPI